MPGSHGQEAVKQIKAVEKRKQLMQGHPDSFRTLRETAWHTLVTIFEA
jgi:hypothetical protein